MRQEDTMSSLCLNQINKWNYAVDNYHHMYESPRRLAKFNFRQSIKMERSQIEMITRLDLF